MGPRGDNMAGKGKSKKNMDPTTTKQRMRTSGSAWPTAPPAITSGTSAANVATAIDAVTKTLVSDNASNVQTMPSIPVKRHHEGSNHPNISRAKTSEPTMAIEEKASANAVDSDEFETLFAPYRPVHGTNVASPSSPKSLSGGPEPVKFGMFSIVTTNSKTASEVSKSIDAKFNTVGMPDTTTTANKPLSTFEVSGSLFGGSFSATSATPAYPNAASTPPKSLFTMPNSSQTRTSVPLFGVPSDIGTPYVVPKSSGSSTLPIDFSTPPMPNPTVASPLSVFKIPDKIPIYTPNTKGPFGMLKTPSESIFKKPDLLKSGFGDGQGKGLFATLSEQASQSKSNPFSPSSTSTSAYPPTAANLTKVTSESKRSSIFPCSTSSSACPFTAANPAGSFSGNESEIQTCVPSIFKGSQLPLIQPVFDPKMATADGIPNSYAPPAPTYTSSSPYQQRDHTMSGPFRPSRSWTSPPTATLAGNSNTQQPGHRSSFLVTAQTTNEVKFDKPEDLVAYQKSTIQEIQSSMAWLKEQNEIVNHNIIILTENLKLCGVQLQYFSNRCDDLNDLYKNCREEIMKLQEKLDELNAIDEGEKEEEGLASEGFKKETHISQPSFVVGFYISVYIIIVWLVIIIYNRFF